MTTSTRSNELKELRERLAEISKQLDNEQHPSKRESLINEEQRALAQIRDLSDETLEVDDALAKRLVDEQGANADEIPILPDEATESDVDA